MILGVFFLSLGCYLVWRNEANQVCSTGAFQVASEHTHELGDTCSVNKEHSDLFLHLTCPVDQESLVTSESSTGISAKGAYKLKFLTEQYGYVQTHETQKKCKTIVTTSGEVKDICSDENESCSCFNLQWTTNPVSSTAFSSAKLCNKCKDKYEAPPVDTEWGNTPVTKIGSFTFYAEQLPLGDGTLKIDKSNIPAIQNVKKIPAPKYPTTIKSNSFEVVESQLCGEGETVTCYYSTSKRVADKDNYGYYGYSTDTSAAHLGDLRMKVEAFGSRVISALGKEVQSDANGETATIKPALFGGSSVPPCQARSIFYVTDGKFGAEELYEKLQSNLNNQTVIFRIITMLVVAFGFHLTFLPLRNSVQSLPIIGMCFTQVLHILTVLATLALWMAVFAIAWIFYRPLFGTLVLILVVLASVGTTFLYKKNAYKELPNGEGVIDIEMDSIKVDVQREMV